MSAERYRFRRIGAAACFLLAGLAPLAAAKGQVALRVADGRAGCDGVVKVPVELHDPGGLGALDVVFSHDPEMLEFVKAEQAVAVEDATFLHKRVAPGKVRCGLISTTAIEAEGVVFTLRFRARGKPGTTEVKPENAQAWAARNAFVLRVSAQPGTWTLQAPSSSSTSGTSLGWVAAGGGAIALLVIVFLLGRRSRTSRPTK